MTLSPLPTSKTRETQPVLIAYEKEINKRRHARIPAKTIRGNVILFIYEDLIDYFNIRTYNGLIPIASNVNDYEREIFNRQCNVSGYQRPKRSQSKAVRKVIIQTKDRNFPLNFPHFFNIAMIRDSLYLIIKKNIETAKFKAQDSQKKRSIFIGNKDMVQVFLPKDNELIEPRNIDASPYSTVTVVDAPIRRVRSLRLTAR